MVNHDLITDLLSRLATECTANNGQFTQKIADDVEKSIRTDWGGDRYFVARHRGASNHSDRNSRIQRDHLNGERVALLSRRYELTEQRIRQVLRSNASEAQRNKR